MLQTDVPLFIADYGGAGRPVLLIHGLGGSSVHWAALGPLLAERYRTIAVDVPGFGRTPAPPGGFDLEGAVAIISHALRELTAPAIVVGNSLGGLLAMLLAGRHTSRVAGLVLMAPVVRRPIRIAADPRLAWLYGSYIWPGLGEAVRGVRRAVLGPSGLARSTVEICVARPDRVPGWLMSRLVAEAREQALVGADRSYLAALRSTWRFLLRPRAYARMVAGVHVPTLVLQGASDRLVSTSAVLRLAHGRPGWTARLLPDVGHCPQLEVPELICDLVRDWIDNTVEGAGPIGVVAHA